MFKKILEYNSLKNVNKRLMELNNIQRVFFIVFFTAMVYVLILITPFGGSSPFYKMLYYGPELNETNTYIFLTLVASALAMYLFKSKK